MSRPADLRAWIARIESLGELQHVSGAHWDLEIGTISEVNYRRKPPRRSSSTTSSATRAATVC